MRSSFLFSLVPLQLLGGVLAAAPPVDNDECALAMLLAVNDGCVPTSADWNDATQSLPADTCGGFASPSANDLWYYFIATSSSTIVQVMSGAGNDAVIEAFGGDCALLNALACSDETLIGGLESIMLSTNIGQIYRVRTYWWDYDVIPSDLSFSICVFNAPPSPVNDACTSVTAEPLSVGSSLNFTGTTAGADTSGDHVPGSALYGSEPSVWHAFTLSECARVTIAYCTTDPAFESVWNVLTTGCPADSVLYATSFDLSGCGDGNTTLHFDSLAAGTYYLPVRYDANEANGPYVIEVSASACVVGIDEQFQEDGWVVFTVDDGIMLWHDAPLAGARFEIFGADGKRIHAGSLEPVLDGYHRIPLPGSAASGIGVLRLIAARRTHAWRVLFP